jgi:hypothetical protein
MSDDVAYVAGDGYYGDDPDDLEGEHDRLEISYSDAMEYEFIVTATDDGRIKIERQESDDG